MITLSLADTETVVAIAFAHFLEDEMGSFDVQVGDHKIHVNVEIRGGRFDCGTPGFNMANANVAALRPWTGENIRLDHLVGGLAPCKDVGHTGQVNVVLRDERGSMMFNFHVNLVAPC